MRAGARARLRGRGVLPPEGPAQTAAWRPPRRGAGCWWGLLLVRQAGAGRNSVAPRGPRLARHPPPPHPHPVPPRAQACCQGSSPRHSPAHPAVRDQSGSSQGAPPNAGGARCPPWTSWHPLAPPPAHPSRGGFRRDPWSGAAPAPSVPLLRPHPCVLEFSRCCLVPQIVSCCSREGAKSAMAYVAVSVTSLPDSPLFGLFFF